MFKIIQYNKLSIVLNYFSSLLELNLKIHFLLILFDENFKFILLFYLVDYIKRLSNFDQQ